MMDMLSIFTLNNLGRLRELSMDRKAVNHEHLVDGVYLSWDDAQAHVTVRMQSKPGRLLDIKAEMSGKPRWMTLNFALGVGSLLGGDILCMIMDAQSDCKRALPIFIRSKCADRLQDLYWDESINLIGQNQVAIALSTTPLKESVIGECFHTIVIVLPHESFSVSIRDIRLLTIGSEQSVPPPPPTLSSTA